MFKLHYFKLLEYFREPTALMGILLFPLIWMLVLGFAFSDGKIEKANVAIVFADSQHTNLLSSNETLNNSFNILQSVTKDEEKLVLDLYKQDKVLLIAEVGEENTKFRYSFNDRSAKAAAYEMDRVISSILYESPSEVTVHQNISQRGKSYIEFLVPGILAFGIFSTCLFGMSMSIVANRRDGLFKRFAVTPFDIKNYFFALVSSRSVILVVEVLSIALASYFIFKFSLFNRLLPIFVFSIIGAACFSAIAIAFGAKSADVGWVSTLVKLFSLPSILLSGAFFSIAAFPASIHGLIKCLPLTAFVDGMRKIAFDTLSFELVFFESTVLILWGLAFFIYSYRVFNWK